MTGFDSTTLLQSAGYLFFFIFMFYGQKIQMFQMLGTIQGKLKKLAKLRTESYNRLLTKLYANALVDMSKEQIDTQVKRLVNSIAIPPAALDPAGLVPKMKATFSAYESYMKANLRMIAPKVSDSELQSLMCMLEVTMSLNQIYLVVEHFFKLGKKQGAIFVYQLAMIIGMILEMADDLYAALPSFEKGITELIGDSFGPLVASKFTEGVTSVAETAPETQVHYTNFDGRDIFVVRAKGPGGTVGRPDEAVEVIMKEVYEHGGRVASVVSIDAALRMESETTGDIAEGAGFAMGGSGAERWGIEQACVNYKVPSYAVVCKMSNKEAISSMPKVVLDQVAAVKERVEWFIRFQTQPGDTVIVAGIGNSQGVA